MTINYDLDQLMSVYADWVIWLREKERNLEHQLAKMRGKVEPDVDAAGQFEAANETMEAATVETEPESGVDAPALKEMDEDEDDWL